jgi:hypothetical protein
MNEYLEQYMDIQYLYHQPSVKTFCTTEPISEGRFPSVGVVHSFPKLSKIYPWIKLSIWKVSVYNIRHWSNIILLNHALMRYP